MDPPTTERHAVKNAFNHKLARIRAIYLSGWMLAAGLRILAFALASLLSCVLLDALFAFDERTRMGMGTTLLLGTLAMAGYGMVAGLSLSRRAIACWVDGLLPSRRRPVLSALELAEAPEASDSSTFGPFLKNQALDQGIQAMARLSAWQCLPRRLLKRDALRLGMAVATWGLLWAIWNAPVRTHALRLLAPSRDIPPWSRITFAITPPNPSAIYGDSIEIAATVEGPVGGSPILFEVRDVGHTYRSAGFRESTNRFVHRLERVVQPLQFCVRAGRARSPWHHLTVLYQPRIASARITLMPPEYTGLPKREFYLGGQKLSGLGGSQVTLDITANRPIRRGHLLFIHPDGTETRVEGRASGNPSIRYEWKIEGNATVRIHIQDPLGTANARTHEFTQELLPDESPTATLLEPARFSLATPDSRIQVEAVAEDSLGLRSFALIRNLAGYRDRALPIGIAAGARQAQGTSPLDLRMLGVQPGDSIELYAEATDTRPDLLGTAMSDISRIDVISNDEYAEILRMRTAVEEFGERYALVANQLKQLREALQALASQNDKAPGSPEGNREATQQVLDAWKNLDESYQRIASDFAIYDMEKQLPGVLEAIRSRSEPHAHRLMSQPHSLAESAEIAAQWIEAIRESSVELDRQAEDAKLADQLLQVARSALQLQWIIDRQAALVRSLNRYEANLRATPASLLAQVAQDQDLVATLLRDWLEETATLADALPADQASLAKEMHQVVDAIREGNALSHMEHARAAAQNENAPDADRYAKAALDALRNACSQCEKSGNGYAGMCRNPGHGFHVKPGLCNTMSQLCQALMRQFGGENGATTGIGMGGGGSFGGDPGNGYWTSASSVLDVPLHGPPRSSLQVHTGQGRGHAGSGKGTANTLRATERMDRQLPGSTATRAVSLDEIPERYREPARIFYGIDTLPEGHPTHE